MIEAPETITIEAIDGEPNAERRRVLVERFGFDRLVREGRRNASSRGRDRSTLGAADGRIDWRRDDEPLVVVEVLNSTPGIRRLAKDLLPAGAAANADGPRGRRLDLRVAGGRVPANRRELNRYRSIRL